MGTNDRDRNIKTQAQLLRSAKTENGKGKMPRLVTGIALLLVLFGSAYTEKNYKSTCETIPSEIHITKDEFHKASGTTRTCEQSVAVNKCEGACASSLRPSALNANGFQKKCECCRESSHRQRSITLTNCYDSDGGRLSGALGSMTVTVNEPMGCKCFSCS